MKLKFIIILSIALSVGCSTKKEILLFQGIENLNNLKNSESFEPVFEINDVIQIRVSSINPEVVAPFQMTSTNTQNQTGGGGDRNAMIGYLIDINGNIQFPVLGQVPVAGKTRSEFESYLTKELKKYVTDAVVAVRLLNFRVTVLGETGESVVQVENERITVPELIATVGGIPYTGKRENILVIREIAGERTYGYVDLTSAEVFENPFYYLRQNDIVYVEPTYKQVKSAGWITSPTGIISLGTTIFSLIVLFSR